MTYYKKSEYKLVGYEKSKRKGKMYNAKLKNKKTGRVIRLPFGDSKMQNYQDKTGLNTYPQLIHGDSKRRASFRARHRGYLKVGYWSPSWFSYYILW